MATFQNSLGPEPSLAPAVPVISNAGRKDRQDAWIIFWKIPNIAGRPGQLCSGLPAKPTVFLFVAWWIWDGHQSNPYSAVPDGILWNPTLPGLPGF